MGMDAIPIDLLELILLFIASPVFLVRAASTCKQWRRIIAKADFLRRFRCLHRPPVAGYYYDSKRFSPSSPPVINGHYFSLDFLPGSNDYINPGVWRFMDSRGSLLLFDYYSDKDEVRHMFICEPVTKRSKKIQAVSAPYPLYYNTAFLLDGNNVQPDGISMSNFRVLCLLHYGNRMHAKVFTLGDSWRETSIESQSMNFIGLALGSMYWYAGHRKVVTFDQSSAKFSSFTLPDIENWDSHVNQHRLAVTASRDGMVRVVVGVAGGDMKVFARLPGGSCEWVLKKRIPLFTAISSLPWREAWYFQQLPISSHRTGAVLIITTRMSLLPRQTTPLMFRLDIETMAVERMPDPNMGIPYPCELPWPPIFHVTDHDDHAT
ncbi:hypothetical protein BAE44_0014189 [Dichanthelium oligosanthes]|uniref:F-box domain-containing protein n=1 Tax=Dichanthelium oligosanthes TaxID=888268 RepID=A0A1E5VI51_9POAL|nr:hypothetical protein BAE44_0014189 [Dichanthelium oligosanthes]